MLKNINKSNIEEIAHYFSKHRNVKQLLGSFHILLDNEYGTLFVESIYDDSIKFSLHKNDMERKYFDSVTFSGNVMPNLTIDDLIEIYPIFHQSYIAHDDEYGFAFKSISGSYTICAFLNGKIENELDDNRMKIIRLTIEFDNG